MLTIVRFAQLPNELLRKSSSAIIQLVRRDVAPVLIDNENQIELRIFEDLVLESSSQVDRGRTADSFLNRDLDHPFAGEFANVSLTFEHLLVDFLS